MNESIQNKIKELDYWLEQLEISTQSKIWQLKCVIDNLKIEVENKEEK